MNQFATHVYATVRVMVIGTNFSTNPDEIAEKVTDAVCADSSQWMKSVHGVVSVDGHGPFDIEAVEFADGIYGVLVDELDPKTGRVVKEHNYDETCSPRIDEVNVNKVVADVIQVLKEHPDANVGNSKVHFALMRLKGLMPSNRNAEAETKSKPKKSVGMAP